jgi:hypothetical protein
MDTLRFWGSFAHQEVTMKIALFGAGGMIGRRIAEEAPQMVVAAARALIEGPTPQRFARLIVFR